jgi:mRNA interferase RelE/StbE
MYEVELSQEADRQLSKLDTQIQIRIVSALERCRIRPYPYVKKLVASPCFRLRVGDYRVILDIKDDKLIILVVEIVHRKNLYKK